jgi:Fur family ferric uptake transcriptional regulator
VSDSVQHPDHRADRQTDGHSHHRAEPSRPAEASAPGASAEIIRSLAQDGHRLTAPRRVIVDFVARRHDHFSAQEVWEDLRGHERGVGRATVFRTLELLAELGVLDRVHSLGHRHRYAVCEPQHHHHLMCLDCSSVVLVSATDIEEEIRQVTATHGFELLTHHLELIGRCAACRARAE